MSKPDLLKLDRFVAAYIGNGCIAAAAARTAGYSPANSRKTGTRLLNEPYVMERIAEARKEIQDLTKYDAQKAMAELDDAVQQARTNKQGTALVRAIELRAKLNGLLIDRSVVDVHSRVDLRGVLDAANARVARAIDAEVVKPDDDANPFG